MSTPHHADPTTGRQPAAGRLSLPQPLGTARTVETERDRSGQVTSHVQRTVLPGGLRVITERTAGARSATVGVWVGVGSRHEAPRLHGCSHFLEHLLFKGTRERSAMDLSVELEAVGGEVNAWTAQDHTCFHARVLGEDLLLAVDVLGDMVTSSRIDAADVEAEREVVLDEIAMHDDDPDDVVHELLVAQAWGDTPLGRPIAGTEESIAALTRDQVARFYRSHYRPARTVVAAAGDVDHDAVVAQVEASFGRGGWLRGDDAPVLPRPTLRARRVRAGERRTARPTEQVNLLLAVGGITRSDPRRYALGVLNTALGGGTSSRLFQEVRERRGLAYSVYSFASHHEDAGLLAVSAGCLPAKHEELLATVRAELRALREHGLTAEEVERGRGQLRGGLVLGLEDSAARMSRLGKAELLHGELTAVDEVLARIDAVTPEDVAALAATLLAGPEVLAVVGPG